jgi:hypothetical protein
MATDQKQPVQLPLIVDKLAMVDGFGFPKVIILPPPLECETQQLMDFACAVAIFESAKQPFNMKWRITQAYAKRWNIEVVELNGPEDAKRAAERFPHHFNWTPGQS